MLKTVRIVLHLDGFAGAGHDADWILSNFLVTTRNRNLKINFKMLFCFLSLQISSEIKIKMCKMCTVFQICFVNVQCYIAEFCVV